jgi:hypothetical protein
MLKIEQEMLKKEPVKEQEKSENIIHLLDEKAENTRKLSHLLESLKTKFPFLSLEYIEKIIPILEKNEVKINKVKMLKLVEKLVGISPVVSFVFGLVGSTSLIIKMMRKNPLFTSQFLSVFYPIIASLKAVERPRLNDDERWLTFCILWLIRVMFWYDCIVGS